MSDKIAYNAQSMTDYLHDLSMDSGQDEECGSATEGAGWAALFLNITQEELREAGMLRMAEDGPINGAILYCDTQGFYTSEEYETEELAREAWVEVRAELEPEGEYE